MRATSVEDFLAKLSPRRSISRGGADRWDWRTSAPIRRRFRPAEPAFAACPGTRLALRRSPPPESSMPSNCSRRRRLPSRYILPLDFRLPTEPRGHRKTHRIGGLHFVDHFGKGSAGRAVEQQARPVAMTSSAAATLRTATITREALLPRCGSYAFTSERHGRRVRQLPGPRFHPFNRSFRERFRQRRLDRGIQRRSEALEIVGSDVRRLISNLLG